MYIQNIHLLALTKLTNNQRVSWHRAHGRQPCVDHQTWQHAVFVSGEASPWFATCDTKTSVLQRLFGYRSKQQSETLTLSLLYFQLLVKPSKPTKNWSSRRRSQMRPTFDSKPPSHTAPAYSLLYVCCRRIFRHPGNQRQLHLHSSV